MMHMQNFGTSSVPHRPYKCRLTEGGLSVLDSLPMCVGGQLSMRTAEYLRKLYHCRHCCYSFPFSLKEKKLRLRKLKLLAPGDSACVPEDPDLEWPPASRVLPTQEPPPPAGLYPVFLLQPPPSPIPPVAFIKSTTHHYGEEK